MTCRECGRPTSDTARFCTACGTPVEGSGEPGPTRTDPKPTDRRVAIALGATTAVVVAGALALVLLPSRDEPAAAAPAPATAAAPPTAARPSTTVPPSTALADQRETDRDTVASLVGYWIPQVSAKSDGLVVNGVTFGPAEIHADFVRLRDRFPDAVLLRSEDYPSFRNPGYWVTVVAVPFPDAAGANRWCDDAGLAADDCFAKRLVTTGGPAGNTVPR